jgi:hypothetical protein
MRQWWIDSLTHCAFNGLRRVCFLLQYFTALGNANAIAAAAAGMVGELVLDDETAERRAVRDALAALGRGRREAPVAGIAQGRRGGGGRVDGGRVPEPVPGLDGVRRAADDLAPERAESEVVEEAATADLADVRGRGLPSAAASGLVLLRALVEEDDARAVDDVGLHAGDVEEALDVVDPDDVVVGGAADLDGVVAAVGVREAERAERAGGGAAVEAEHVALAAAVRVGVRGAVREEARREQREQPARPLLRRRRLVLRLRAAASLQKKTHRNRLVSALGCSTFTSQQV